jgi:hypothetical protein
MTEWSTGQPEHLRAWQLLFGLIQSLVCGVQQTGAVRGHVGIGRHTTTDADHTKRLTLGMGKVLTRYEGSDLVGDLEGIRRVSMLYRWRTTANNPGGLTLNENKEKVIGNHQRGRSVWEQNVAF